ncbi:MAG: UDP-N-acetylmuramoyl-tripeptide--D-alanyl-D-alanine ligase [Anaerovoracaceae bacterium]|jgi:UDP-N-acetylmuramoyl-tripeptide--D-alanyl-D-alanine ligase
MERITAARAAELAGSKLISGPENNEIDRVERDSREAGPDSIFIALKGEKNDANDFVSSAYDNGCRVFLISSDKAAEELEAHDDASVIMTDDTLKAMQVMAKNYLAQFDILKIAVTGSTGKTTTKDMLNCIFSYKYKTVCNFANYNNHIGVPLTVFDVDSSTEAGIFEMGMNHAGEIKVLADIVRPDIACITNIGVSHIGNLGSRDNIMKAKLEITSYMDENCTLVYNADDDKLAQLNDMETKYKKLAAGENADQDGVILVPLSSTGEENMIAFSPGESADEGISFILRYNKENMMFYMPLPGMHNAVDAAVAVGCAVTAGMDIMDCSEALLHIELTGGRLTVRRSGELRVIDDTYNASPDAVKAALDVLAETSGTRRIAVLADMLELGDRSEEFHREIGKYVVSKGVDILAAVGENASYIADGAAEASGDKDIKILRFKDCGDFISKAGEIIKDGDVILVKGSHSMNMGDAVSYLMKLGAGTAQEEN